MAIKLPPHRILLAHRTAVIEYIKGQIPEFREVSSHGGTFTEDALKRFSAMAPACKIALLGMQGGTELDTGEMSGPQLMAAFVLCEDEPPLESYDVATIFVERLIEVINGSALGTPRGGMAQVREWQNLFSMSSERAGTTLMGVTWNQDVRFGKDYSTDDTMPWWAQNQGIDESALSNVTGIGAEFAFSPPKR